MLGIEVPRRARVIRVMLDELQRIAPTWSGWGPTPSTSGP